MRSRRGWIGWGMALGLIGLGAWGAEPDPEEVRRRMEKYEREAAEEAAKPALVVDHDREAWQSAEKCGTAACFRAYLEDYPKGRYAKMAQARLEPKSESRPKAAERPTPPPRPAETLLANRYRDNSDGTVTDVRTGLQWMRCSLGQTWRGGTCAGEAETYSWQAALDVASALNRQGGYAGHRDWRVPTIEELRTLVYCSSGQPETWKHTRNKCEGDYQRPTLYPPAFPNTPALAYWSSSSYANYPGLAWHVYFLYGYADVYVKSYDDHARLVRDGQ
jgi:hypothetical protein